MSDNELTAGREIDKRIAEKIMGCPEPDIDLGSLDADRVKPYDFSSGPWGRIWYPAYSVSGLVPKYGEWTPMHFSTEIEEAWFVIEHVYKETGEWITVIRGPDGEYLASATSDYWVDCVSAETAPLAICLAALKIMEAQEAN